MRIAVIIASILLCESLSAQSLSKWVVFSEKVYNFGKIKESDGKVSHKFIFENRGSGPVVITGVQSGCGCIAISYTKKPIKSKERGDVEIQFSPLYKSGFFFNEVEISINGGKEYVSLWVKGHVLPMRRAVEEEYAYNFGEGLFLANDVASFVVKGAETKHSEIFYTNDTDKKMILNFVVDGGVKLKFDAPVTIPAKGVGSVKFYYRGDAADKKEKREFRIVPYINNKRCNNSITGIIYNVTN